MYDVIHMYHGVLLQYPTQICRLGLLHAWTKECESSIAELKAERKALHYASKRWTANTMTRLTPVMGRSMFRGCDEPMQPYHRCRLEAMFTVSVKLYFISILNLILKAIYLFSAGAVSARRSG